MPIDTGIPEFRNGFTRFCLTGTNTRPEECKLLLIGQMLPTGTATPGQVTPVFSENDAYTKFGAGSLLADAIRIAFYNYPDKTIYALPLSDAAGSTAAVWQLSVTGPAAQAGSIYLQIYGRDYVIPVQNGDTAATIATNIAAVIGADATLPFSVTASGSNVIFTARNAGTSGNYFSVVINPYIGQQLPAGVNLALVQTTAGAGDPVLTATQINDALGTCCYDCIGLIYYEEATVQALVRYLDDETGTWSCNTDQCFGHLFHVYPDATVGDIVAYGNASNDQERTIIPYLDGYHLPIWYFAAAWAARTCAAGCLDTSRPVVRDNGLLIGLQDAGNCGGIWTRADKEALVRAGVAAWDVSNQRTQNTSTIWIENNVTNYKFNAFGQPDETWQQVAYRYAAARLVKELRQWYEDNYSSVALVSDGVRIPPGKRAVSPSMFETDLKAFLRGYSGTLIEDAGGLDGKVIVERDTEGKPCGWGDANRVNVLIDADLINYLLRIATSINVTIERKNCTTA